MIMYVLPLRRSNEHELNYHLRGTGARFEPVDPKGKERQRHR